MDLVERYVVVPEVRVGRGVDDLRSRHGVAHAECQVQDLDVVRVGADVEHLAGHLGRVDRQREIERARDVEYVHERTPLPASAVDGDASIHVGVLRHHVDREVKTHPRAEAEDGGESQSGNLHLSLGLAPEVQEKVFDLGLGARVERHRVTGARLGEAEAFAVGRRRSTTRRRRSAARPVRAPRRRGASHRLRSRLA